MPTKTRNFKKKCKNSCGDAGDRTRDLSHAKRTLYHWATSPNLFKSRLIQHKLNYFDLHRNFSMQKLIFLEKVLDLPGGESNPGLPRDRRGYSPLYYRGRYTNVFEILGLKTLHGCRPKPRCRVWCWVEQVWNFKIFSRVLSSQMLVLYMAKNSDVPGWARTTNLSINSRTR